MRWFQKIICSLSGRRAYSGPETPTPNATKRTIDEATPQELREASHGVANAAMEMKAISARIQRESTALRRLADEIVKGH